MPEQFESRYFRGQGPLFLGGRDANGAPSGLIFVGDMESVELTPNIENVELVENVTGIGGIGSSFTKRTEFDLTINMRSIKPEHMAQAIQGTVTAEAAGSVSDEVINGYHDAMTPLAHVKVSNVVVGNDATPTVTYVAGTDYVLHADEGLIEVLSTGAITDGQSLYVDYDYVAQHKISSAPSNVEKYLLFAGMNSADSNKQTRVNLYKVKLDPGVMSLITEEHATAPITGRVLLDSLRASGDQYFSWQTED